MRRLLSFISGRVAIFTVLGAVVVAVIAEIVQNSLAGAAAISSSLINVLMLLALLLVLAQLVALRSSVDQLSRKARFSMNYYPAGDRQQIGELHLQAKRVIQRASANAEVYAVNSYVEVFKESNDPASADSQRDYLKAYENKFDKLAKYHRLIQVKNGQDGHDETNLGDLLAPAYLAHYQAMADYAERNPRRAIKLERVSARLPTSFVVVKNGHGGEIIWQINHQVPGRGDPDTERMEGVFIVSDPDGLLVHNFVDWFNALDSGRPSPVEKSHLQTSE